MLYYTDAEHGSPLLDIKPYTPSFDRLEKVDKIPSWCANWPTSIKASAKFDWNSVFTYAED